MKVHFSKKAYKEYKKLPVQYKSLVDKTLKKYSDGNTLDLKPVQGGKNIYRIRIGRYRMLIKKMNDGTLVVSIGSRGDVYK
jgi:mRNA interferase RelE/StbE